MEWFIQPLYSLRCIDDISERAVLIVIHSTNRTKQYVPGVQANPCRELIFIGRLGFIELIDSSGNIESCLTGLISERSIWLFRHPPCQHRIACGSEYNSAVLFYGSKKDFPIFVYEGS